MLKVEISASAIKLHFCYKTTLLAMLSELKKMNRVLDMKITTVLQTFGRVLEQRKGILQFCTVQKGRMLCVKNMSVK